MKLRKEKGLTELSYPPASKNNWKVWTDLWIHIVLCNCSLNKWLLWKWSSSSLACQLQRWLAHNNFPVVTIYKSGQISLKKCRSFWLQVNSQFLVPTRQNYSSFQNKALQTAPSPSPHFECTYLIFSTDLQIPLQLQSNDATHMLPACAFHSQSTQSWFTNENHRQEFLVVLQSWNK